MTENIHKITCKFIGDFEVADNVVRNGDTLRRLSTTNEQGVFNKLIVIQAGSIVEVALAQLVYRAQNYNREGVVNIPEKDRALIADEKAAQFFSLIKLLQDYKVLDKFGADIYDELHKLRRYRLARLAAKFGPDAELDEVRKRLTATCAWNERRSGRRKKHLGDDHVCRAYYCDLEPPMPPPDLPYTRGPRLVVSKKSERIDEPGTELPERSKRARP